MKGFIRMGTDTGDQNSHSRDWSSLAYDLIDHIFRRYLPFSDLLRCRNVCTSWRYVSHTIVKSSTLNSPVLALPKRYVSQQIISSYEETSYLFLDDDLCDPTRWCSFFNPVACELYPLSEKSKQLLEDRSFLGTSKGWALFKRNVVDDLVMFNAPTGTCIRMPCSRIASICINKAVLWGGDPIWDIKSLGIVAITDICDISFAAIRGDKSFHYTLPYIHPYDVIYFNGLVYGVFGKGVIQAWDCNHVIGSFGELTPTKVEHYLPSFNPGKELALGSQLRLVDLSGELWLVSKPGFRIASKLGVYKLDFKERKWVDMDSLGDLVVVLYKNQSIAFSPLGHSKYKRNCVYFEDYETFSSPCCMYAYNLEDGSIAKFHL